jgi:DNA-binding IclR family transcriptional regulator
MTDDRTRTAAPDRDDTDPEPQVEPADPTPVSEASPAPFADGDGDGDGNGDGGSGPGPDGADDGDGDGDGDGDADTDADGPTRTAAAGSGIDPEGVRGDGADYPIKSVKKSYDIVSLLREAGALSLSEATSHLQMTKASVHQHLRTLERLGYVVKADGRYRLGLRYLLLGDEARTRRPLYEVSRTELRKLAKTSGETATLTLVENGHGVAVFHATGGGKELPRPVPLGHPVPLPASAAGRAVLAELPAARRRRHLPDEAWTSLEADVTRINDRAVVVDHDDEAGVNAVARAVVDADDLPIAAVTVLGDVEELRGRLLSEDVVGMLVNTVRSIERKRDDVRVDEGESDGDRDATGDAGAG